ncbi:phage portal protein [Streptomyces sp. NPDC058471]|uniref:phage portal protein n=1 Tax=Streptomyces sp. NPDC058471 TaxID=3346516 RepID=UPI0036518521
MAKLWSSLFGGNGKEEGRFGLNDLYQQVVQYQGLGYPVGGGPGAGENYEAIGDDFEGYVQQAYKSDGVVFACMLARMRLFSQARFQWQKMRDGRPGDLFGNKELSLFEQPWPNGGSTITLLNKAIQQADISGNHYVVRETKRRGAVPVSRLRVLQPNWVRTILTAPPSEAVDCDVAGWLYMPGGTQDRSLWKYYVAGDERFAHWAPTPDPERQFLGMSWLTPVIREVMADKAATRHKGKFFENAATPSFAMSFKETVTAEQFKDFIRAMRETHQGVDNAYKPLYVGGGADITPLMYDLRQLDFKATQGAGETRIAAAARVHPVIVGLSEGMQGSSLNAGNFKAAKDAWGDGEMRPLWESICQAYAPLVKTPEGARLHYDDRDISFLRDDIKEKAAVLAQEADILQGLVMQGWTQDSAIEALMESGCTGDWRKLKHTGLFSVQLQPPMPDGPPVKVVDQNGKAIKQSTTGTPGAAKPATGPGAAGRPAAGVPRPGAKPPPAAK